MFMKQKGTRGLDPVPGGFWRKAEGHPGWDGGPSQGHAAMLSYIAACLRSQDAVSGGNHCNWG